MPRREPPLRGRNVATIALLAALLAGPVSLAAADTPAHPGTRTLLLVRHGEYDTADARDESLGKGLVALGREQARVVARRLAAWPERVTRLYASPLTRARETAAIIGQALRLAAEPDPELAECTPPTPREDVMKDLRPGEADSCRLRLERVVARYFRPTASGDSVEALVCHGNVIRYLVCRALDVDPSRWLQMGIANCSVTEIQIRPDGGVRLLSYDDVGHLPARLLTRTGRPMRPAGTPERAR